MSRVNVLYEQAFKAAEDGHAAELGNDAALAIQHFEQAVQLFTRLASVESLSKRTLLHEHIQDFQQRIQDLRSGNDVPAIPHAEVCSRPRPESTTDDDGRLPDALTADPRWLYATRLEQEAASTEAMRNVALPVVMDAYMRAADEFMEVRRPPRAKSALNVLDQMLRDKSVPDDACQCIRRKVERLIDRITTLKNQDHELEMEDLMMEADLLLHVDYASTRMDRILSCTSLRHVEVKRKVPDATSLPHQQRAVPHDPGHVAASDVAPQAKYTAEEVDVLRRSSVINGRLFQPWIASDEKFDTTEAFTDPDGLLSMSSKQLEKLAKWVRPSEYGTAPPRMVSQISPYVVVQDVVTDCSFVASLCITAAYEMRFHKQLITNIIFPQDPNGAPIVNPGGKYVVKLWANGVPRRVVVDDYLPLGHSGSLLCSCTTESNELWVSIIEKAYLKVNGGYDFPGSNSGIDVFALTGWIPETISFADPGGGDTSADMVWQRLMSAHNFGDCLITIATGDLPKAVAKQVGLVPSHAYAVLNVVETTSTRLLLVKNPWNRKRWRGPYGMDDVDRWTPDLDRELGLDDGDASRRRRRHTRDDGLFWIDFASVQTYFSALFLNWNPDLFRYRFTMHKHWPVDGGPDNDTYNLGYNPQYALTFPTLDRKTKPFSVWILLSRHVTAVEAPTTVQPFLALHVYKQQSRVYYPNNAFARGTYSNNPHALTCVDVELTADGPTTFILVASQYEKLAPVDYTISVFSTEGPFELTTAPEPPPHRIHVMDAWTTDTAGGSPKYERLHTMASRFGVILDRHATFVNNPQYQLVIDDASIERMLLTLEAPPAVELAINLRLVRGDGQRVGSVSKKSVRAQSGEYRPGFCYMEVEAVEAGTYTIVASTFEPHRTGSFSLTVAATSAAFQLFFRLRQRGAASSTINVSLYPCTSTGQLHDPHCNPTTAFVTSAKGSYTNSACGVRTPATQFPRGFYLAIPSTFDPHHGDFDLYGYSDAPVVATRLR
ncbi:hypothetical protein DYB32_002251 [Aphanomyces invadans]|uniref:Calpain catalytic domain-containing protein n=1 Tax=Aphanomyces invadans TaxID=157072 RepID=A0A418B3U2_9STRA|nr:hypothetical protein DYB32_002251 [Aphanomyces invadans]